MPARLIHVSSLIKSNNASTVLARLARRFWIHYNDTRHDTRRDPPTLFKYDQPQAFARSRTFINFHEHPSTDNACSSHAIALPPWAQPCAITWLPKNRHYSRAFARFLHVSRIIVNDTTRRHPRGKRKPGIRFDFSRAPDHNHDNCLIKDEEDRARSEGGFKRWGRNHGRTISSSSHLTWVLLSFNAHTYAHTYTDTRARAHVRAREGQIFSE